MALKIYGSPRSRTMRTLWIAEELQLDYEHIPVAWDDPWLKTVEFLQINRKRCSVALGGIGLTVRLVLGRPSAMA